MNESILKVTSIFLVKNLNCYKKIKFEKIGLENEKVKNTEPRLVQ